MTRAPQPKPGSKIREGVTTSLVRPPPPPPVSSTKTKAQDRLAAMEEVCEVILSAELLSSAQETNTYRIGPMVFELARYALGKRNNRP